MAAPEGATSPDLSVVPPASAVESPTPPSTTVEEKSPPAATPAQAPAEADSKSRKGPLWALAALAVVLAAIAFSQYQRAQWLEGQVQMLNGELSIAAEQVASFQTQLGAYQTHLGLVRGGVDALADRVGSLQALVARDPLAAPGEGPVGDPEAGLEELAGDATDLMVPGAGAVDGSAEVGSAIATPFDSLEAAPTL